MAPATDLQICLFLILYTSILLGSSYMKYRNERKYENEFLNRHRDTISRQTGDDFLPLTFPRRETEHLMDLCRQYRRSFINRVFPNRSEPSIQTHYIAFRRQDALHEPVRSEVIRCSPGYAIVEAGDGVSGFLLQLYLPTENMSIGRDLFCITGKFKYKLEDPSLNRDPPPAGPAPAGAYVPLPHED